MNKIRIMLSLILGVVVIVGIVFAVIKARSMLGLDENDQDDEASENASDGYATIMGKFGE